MFEVDEAGFVFDVNEVSANGTEVGREELVNKSKLTIMESLHAEVVRVHELHGPI